MKKLFYSLVTGAVLLASCVYVQAGTFSVSATLNPGGITNLVTSTNLGGSATVTLAILSSTTATNTAVSIYDSPTNGISYVTGSYTNILSYGTNYVTLFTNYYNQVVTYTNIAQVDVTNAVGALTNNYQLKLALIAPLSAAQVYQSLSVPFTQGITVTNTGSGAAQITLTLKQN
jgi:hypothetical protein